ncbi:MAG TPA: hypothetical protein DCS21_12040 [Gammaproteobacteria bacterium]|nr:hypothetical protein [Gammaproteobacteria bacterium]
MEPKSRLNIAVVLLIVASIGLLYVRLAMLYAPLPPVSQLSSETTTGQSQSSRGREDATLFDQAMAAGLLRWERGGRIAVVPADLPLRHRWAREHPEWLTPHGAEPDWLECSWNDEVSRLHRALHFSASGRYVRQHIDLFNARQPEFPHIQQRDGRLIWHDRP